MSAYQHLIGQSFTRNGTRFTVIKCEGATVIAGFLHKGRLQRMLVPLGDVLKSLDVTEIEMTELPTAPREAAPREAPPREERLRPVTSR